MSSDANGKGPKNNNQSREDRMKAALKANMAKRKSQARARRANNVGSEAAKKTGEDKADG